MAEKTFYVYILSNLHRTLYTGGTNDILERMMAHKQGTGSKYAKRYNINRLVYFEETDEAYAAISREKQIKGWKRRKKLDLIESINPEWKDLSYSWFEPGMFG